jgi:hypothetical protein
MAMERLVSEIPAGNGKTAYLFYSVYTNCLTVLVQKKRLCHRLFSELISALSLIMWLLSLKLFILISCMDTFRSISDYVYDKSGRKLKQFSLYQLDAIC